MNELQVRSSGRQIGKRRINSAFRTREIVPDSALGLGIASFLTILNQLPSASSWRSYL